MILGALSVLRDLERIYAPSDLLKQPSCLSVVVARPGTRAAAAMVMAGNLLRTPASHCHLLFLRSDAPGRRFPNHAEGLTGRAQTRLSEMDHNSNITRPPWSYNEATVLQSAEKRSIISLT